MYQVEQSRIKRWPGTEASLFSPTIIMLAYFNRLINFTGGFFCCGKGDSSGRNGLEHSGDKVCGTHTHTHSLTHIQRIPVWAKLPQDEADKLPESIWKCGVYTVTWSWAAYLVLFREKNLFTDLVAHWECE